MNKRYLIWIFALFFLVSAVFAACPSGNVVALGDSITYHAETQSYGFLKVLKSQCPSQDFKGFGYPGKESGEVLTHFDAAASSGNYKTIIVFAGINDLRAGKSASSIEANLAQIYSKAKTKGYSVIALTMVPWKDHVDSEDPSNNWNVAKQSETNKLNQWIRSKPSNVDAVVDIYSKLAAEPDKMKRSYHVGDNLHPYIEGHKIIADAILQSGFSSSQISSTTSTSPSTPTTPITTVNGAIANYRFVVLPDTHTQCSKGFPAPASKAIDTILKDIKPQFVLHVGDMVDFETKKSKTPPCPDVMWSKFDKEIVKKLTDAKIPFFPTPGNHDYQFGMSGTYKDKWSKFKNSGITVSGSYSSWYSFDIGKDHFVSLVAPGEVILTDSAAQMAWLKADLKAAKDKGAQNIFTFAHSPIYVPAMKKGSREFDKDSPFLAKQKGLTDLLKKYNVKIHFSGYMHIFSDKTQNGIHDVIAVVISGGDKGSLIPGGTGEWTFTVVDVKGQDVKVYPISYPSYSTSALPALDSNVKFASSQATVPVGQNIPFGTISSTLYDIVITAALGKTEILGIARQPIAVGVSKKSFSLPSNFVCRNVTPSDKLDIAMLKSNYGAQKTDIEPQLVNITFMKKSIKVHRKIAPLFTCLEKDIKACNTDYEFKTLKGFEWTPLEGSENADLGPSSFGIVITVNPETNPSAPTLQSDIPQCIIKAFNSKGFYWGGNFSTTKIPSSFYFLADPSQIALYDSNTKQPLTTAASSVPASGNCVLQIPAGLDSQSIGAVSSSRGGGRLENAFKFPKETPYTLITGHRDPYTYTTVEMAQSAYLAACLAFPVTNSKIGYGDFSKEKGGLADGRHLSHQSGRDVDVWFYNTNRKKGHIGIWVAVTDDLAKPCNPNRKVSSQFDVPANWEYIKQWLTKGDVQRIYVHCSIEKALVEYAKQKDPALAAKAASVMRYFRHHNHHFHIRINCPKGDEKCVN